MRVSRKVALISLIVIGVLGLAFVGICGRDFVPVRPIPKIGPTTLASTDQMGSRLLVENRNPQDHSGHFDYIMPDGQQRQILANAGMIKLGMTFDQVITLLGPPMKDEWWHNPWIHDQPYFRHVSYYFGANFAPNSRLLWVAGGEPYVDLFFNESNILDGTGTSIANIGVADVLTLGGKPTASPQNHPWFPATAPVTDSTQPVH